MSAASSANRLRSTRAAPATSDKQMESSRPTDINNNTVSSADSIAQPDRNNNNINQHNSQRERVKRKSLDMYDCKLVCFASLIYHLALSLAVSASMNLPDGIENILGFVPRSSFQCERDGYFGDTENDCRLFHLCQKQVHPNGRTEWRHWTYACGNQTMFNQLTLTCAFVDEAIPCKHASQFQYLNEVIHRPREPFLTDADVTSGFSYYSNRIMSDGARARAYEDSNLLAQLGGGAHKLVPSQPSGFNALIGASPDDEPSNRAHNSIGVQQQLPLSAAFQTALGRNFNSRQASTPLDNGQRQFAAEPTARHHSLAFGDDSMSPVASNLPEPATSALANELGAQTTPRSPNLSAQQDFPTPSVESQSHSNPTEGFNFALTTNHQFDAESPVVSVRTTGSHSFSFPPPQAAPSSSSTTVAPDLATSEPNLMTTTAFASQISPQPQASVATTVNPSLFSTRTQPQAQPQPQYWPASNRTHPQDAQAVTTTIASTSTTTSSSSSATTSDSLTTTPDEAAAKAATLVPTTLRSAQAESSTLQSQPRRSSQQQEVAHTSGRPTARQSQRRRQQLSRSGSFESTRISANQTQQARQAANSNNSDVSIVMRRQASSNERRSIGSDQSQEQQNRDHRTSSSLINNLVPAKLDLLIASSSKRRV